VPCAPAALTHTKITLTLATRAFQAQAQASTMRDAEQRLFGKQALLVHRLRALASLSAGNDGVVGVLSPLSKSLRVLSTKTNYESSWQSWLYLVHQVWPKAC
jgi:hypothetical protein